MAQVRMFGEDLIVADRGAGTMAHWAPDPEGFQDSPDHLRALHFLIGVGADLENPEEELSARCVTTGKLGSWTMYRWSEAIGEAPGQRHIVDHRGNRSEGSTFVDITEVKLGRRELRHSYEVWNNEV